MATPLLMQRDCSVVLVRVTAVTLAVATTTPQTHSTGKLGLIVTTSTEHCDTL